MFSRFLKDRRGATAIEYGLIVAVLSLAIVSGVGMTANSVTELFMNPDRALQNTLGN
jgi:pilus assembly protein Flp/PilA